MDGWEEPRADTSHRIHLKVPPDGFSLLMEPGQHSSYDGWLANWPGAATHQSLGVISGVSIIPFL